MFVAENFKLTYLVFSGKISCIGFGGILDKLSPSLGRGILKVNNIFK